jgi:hypothetical protein
MRGSFMSVTSSVQQIASGLASLLAGFIIYETQSHALVNYNIVGIIAVFASMISVFLVWKLKTTS